MGKKKARDTYDEANAVPGMGVDIDAMFGGIVNDVGAKRNKAKDPVGAHDEIMLMPVPSLAVRYLLQSAGYPLARVIEVVGAQASYKSTFAIELARWHMLCAGRAVLLEVESKPTPDLRNAILAYDNRKLHVESCGSLESWQRTAMYYQEQFRKQCEKAAGPGRTIPFAIIVDSLMAKACEETQKKVRENGHAKRDFAVEAMLIKTWMQVFPNEIVGWPFSFIGVNHMKPGTDKQGLPTRNIPGGTSVKFQESVQIELTRMRVNERVHDMEVIVRLQTYKNSYGRDRVRIQVPLRFWHEIGGDGVQRLYAKWEWWTATTNLLTGGGGLADAANARLQSRIKDIIDVHEKGSKMYWSNRLGVPSSDPLTAHEFGMLIESDVPLLCELYDALGIAYRPFFMPGVRYMAHHSGDDSVLLHAETSQRIFEQQCDTDAAAREYVQM